MFTNIVTTQQQISSNYTIDDTYVELDLSTIGSNSYMFEVVSMTENDLLQTSPYMTTIEFRNSVFNVSNGNLFYSNQPVNLKFINCTFFIKNPTESYINLDYKPINGCQNNMYPKYGDIILDNCTFQDLIYNSTLSSSSSTTDYQKYLFRVTSSYSVTIKNTNFTKMSSRLVSQFIDNNSNCTASYNLKQEIILSELMFSQTDIVWRFYFNNIKATSSQLSFKLENSNFSYLQPVVQEFMQIQLNQNTAYSYSGFSSQQFHIQNNNFDNIALNQTLLNMALKSSNVTISSNTFTNCSLMEIIKVSQAEYITLSRLTLINISNPSTTIVATKALLNFQSSLKDIFIDRLNVTSSNILTQSTLLIDKVLSLTITNTYIQDTFVNKSDFMVINQPQSFVIQTTNINGLKLLGSQNQRYVFLVTKLQLVQSQSTFAVKEILMKNSQPQLIKINGAVFTSSSDTSKYYIEAKFCDFYNNVFSGLDLFSFVSLTTDRFDLDDNFCFKENQIPTCKIGTYFDTILKICQKCLDKCESCNNEYSCITYAKCLNPFQTLNSAGQCQFKCNTGLMVDANTCSTCSDSNCDLCLNNSNFTNGQICARCKNGMYLDLTTYQCVATCPTLSKSIDTYNQNTGGVTGQRVSFCRPFRNGVNLTYQYFVDSSASYNPVALGTIEYPYGILDTPFKEIMNFMFEKETEFTVNLKRGTTYKIHHKSAPLYVLNIRNATLNSYGDLYLSRPTIYLTTMPPIFPDYLLYSVVEASYNMSVRVQRKDMSVVESQIPISRYGSIRSNVTFLNVKFQSIMIGEQLYNDLQTATDSFGTILQVQNCEIDIDGRVTNNFYPQTTLAYYNRFNLTNMFTGFYLDIQATCPTNETMYARHPQIFIGNYFFARHQQALLSFFQLVTHDDITLEQNTFDNCSFIAQLTRPFFNFVPSPYCEATGRTQNINFNHNIFMNLKDSNIAGMWIYLTQVKANRAISITNNTFLNSESNNSFVNTTTQSGSRFMIVQGDNSNVTIANETIQGGTFDDLYQIQSANYINITNITIKNFLNPARTTSGTSIFRLLKVLNSINIDGLYVQNSDFNFGSIIQLDQAIGANFSNLNLVNNSLKNGDLFILNQIQKLRVRNISIDGTRKYSEKQRFIITLPMLQMVDNISHHSFRNISFANSECSLTQLQKLNLANTSSKFSFQITVDHVKLSNNSLLKKDSLISIERIQNSLMILNFSNFEIVQNKLSIGQVFYIGSNVKSIGLTNSTVSQNKGQILLLEPALLTKSNILSFEIDNVTFTQNNGLNDGTLWIKTNSQLKVTNSNFTENYSFGRGSVIFADFQEAYALFVNCSFVRNYAINGGVFYASYQSLIEVQHSIVQQNFAITGGVAYVNNDGILKISQNSTIAKNQALNACLLFTINSAFYSAFSEIIIQENDQNNPLIAKDQFLKITTNYKHFKQEFFDYTKTIYDKVFKTSTEKTDSAFLAINSKFLINNTLITQNDNLIAASTESVIQIENTNIQDVITENRMIQSVFSQINMKNVTIQNITYSKSEIGQYLFNIESLSKFTAQDLHLKNIKGLLFYATESQLDQQNFTFTHIQNDDTQKSMFAIDNSVVNKSNVQIFNISQRYISPIYKLDTSNCSFSNMNISNFDKALFLTTNGNSKFDNITVQNYTRLITSESLIIIQNALIFASVSSNLTINNTKVTGIKSNFTSPVINSKGQLTSLYKSNLIIQNSNFSWNQARTSGGAVVSVNNDVMIENVTFESNVALTGSAGALLLDCDINYQRICNYQIQNSLFQNNTAAMNGGAIQYTYYPPIIDGKNNTFTNNSAQYGFNVAAFPVKLEFADNISENKRNLNTQQISRLTDEEVADLGLSNAIVYEILDYQVSGNLITQGFSFFLVDNDNMNLITDSSSEASLIALDPNNVSLLKSRTVSAKQGKFTFNDVIIIAKPGSQVILKIQSDSINQNKIRDAYGVQNKDLYVFFHMRLCERGEYQTKDFKCVQCAEGFYSLYQNQQTCYECPQNAACRNGFQIIVDKGFWRSDVNSTSVYQCPNSDSCLSSYQTNCSEGYGGNLCQSCVKFNDNWYSREETNNCEKCLEYNINSLRLAGVSAIIVIYFLILIVVNVKTIGKQKVTTVYMRILTNYFQILTLAQSYDLSWEDNMKKFLESISFVAKTSELIISQDCFIRDTVDNMHPLFVKMIIATILPLCVIGLIIVVWYIYGKIKRTDSYFNNMIVSITIFIFVAINPITSLTFQLFNCKDIFNDGKEYLVIDNSIQCWTGDHAIYAKASGIPILLIWIFGLPATAMIAMYKRRSQLGEARNIERYGFMYVGLVEEAFYWEILIYFRKVAMISVNVFFMSFKPLYRAVLGFIILIIYIELLQKIKPYQSKQLNYLEFKANIAAFITFYGGLFFISDEFPFEMALIFVALIIILNAYFWISWIKLMFTRQYDIVADFLRKRVFCFLPKRKQNKKAKYDLANSIFGLEEEDSGRNIHHEFEDEASSFYTKNQTMIQDGIITKHNNDSIGKSKGLTSIIRKPTSNLSERKQNEEDQPQYVGAKTKDSKRQSRKTKKPKLGVKEPYNDYTKMGNTTQNNINESHTHLMETPHTRPSKTNRRENSDFDELSQTKKAERSKTKEKERSKQTKKEKFRHNNNLESVNVQTHQQNNFIFNPSNTIDQSVFGDISSPIQVDDSVTHVRDNKSSLKSKQSKQKSDRSGVNGLNEDIQKQNNDIKNQDKVFKIIQMRNQNHADKQIGQKFQSSPARRTENLFNSGNGADNYQFQELEALQSYDQFVNNQSSLQQPSEAKKERKKQKKIKKQQQNYQPSESEGDDNNDNEELKVNMYSIKNKKSLSQQKAMEATFNPNLDLSPSSTQQKFSNNDLNQQMQIVKMSDDRDQYFNYNEPQSNKNTQINQTNNKSPLSMIKNPPTPVVVNQQQDVDYDGMMNLQSPILPFDRRGQNTSNKKKSSDSDDSNSNLQLINQLPLNLQKTQVYKQPKNSLTSEIESKQNQLSLQNKDNYSNLNISSNDVEQLESHLDQVNQEQVEDKPVKQQKIAKLGKGVTIILNNDKRDLENILQESDSNDSAKFFNNTENISKQGAAHKSNQHQQ
eukprot:403343497